MLPVILQGKSSGHYAAHTAVSAGSRPWGYFKLALNQAKGLSPGTDEGRLPLLLLLASSLGPSRPPLLVPCHPVPVSLPGSVAATAACLVDALMCHLEVFCFPWSALHVEFVPGPPV